MPGSSLTKQHRCAICALPYRWYHIAGRAARSCYAAHNLVCDGTAGLGPRGLAAMMAKCLQRVVTFLDYMSTTCPYVPCCLETAVL